jgi:hypothetical protein
VKQYPRRWATTSVHDRGIIMWDKCLPLLFKTRREARAWIEERYSYVKTRKDLRSPPHNWRLPKAVLVEVILKLAPPSNRVESKTEEER